MKYGYKEVRKLGADTLRRLCIERNWYTKGTNSEYSELLNMADRENITTDDIVEMASDIVEHSELSVIDDSLDVMNAIAFKCYTFIEEA